MLSKSAELSHIWTKCIIFFKQIFAIVEADIHKLRHDPYEILTRMIQPSIWLVIFGQAMSNAKLIHTGAESYLDFIAPGILAQSVLFISIFYGIALIWERDVGILHKILVTPAPRVILVLGRSIAAGIRGLSQVVIIFILSLLLGIHLKLTLFSILGTFAIVMLAGAIFSTLSLIVASIVKKRERFMGIGQVLTMPMFFASNALYPIDLMPAWLQLLSIINPLSYQVDALRHLMIEGEISRFGLSMDFGISFLMLAFLVTIATYVYPKILY